MKKIFTAAFILAISFSCISFADSFQNSRQKNNSDTSVPNDSTLALNAAFNDQNVNSGIGTVKESAPANENEPAKKTMVSAIGKTNSDREQELKELCEFLCTMRNCLGECTDMHCLMQQMYFYTR